MELISEIPWEVSKKEIALKVKNTFIPIDTHVAMVRSDNMNVLGINHSRYGYFSNQEFMEMANELVKISGFHLEGYQEIRGGKIMLGYLRNMDKELKIAGCKVKDYLVFGNSFNRETSLFAGSSEIVIRCQNAFGRIHQQVKIVHSSTIKERVKELIRYFENYFAAKKDMYKAMNHWAKVKVDEGIIEEMINYVMKLDNYETTEDIPQQRLNKIEEMRGSINKELIELGDNVWGLFNGVTHYTTHVLQGRSNTSTIGNLYGVKNRINQRAFHFLSEVGK